MSINPKLLNMFQQKVTENFVHLSYNKNAVCVLKAVLRAIASSNSVNLSHFMNKLIECLNENT